MIVYICLCCCSFYQSLISPLNNVAFIGIIYVRAVCTCCELRSLNWEHYPSLLPWILPLETHQANIKWFWHKCFLPSPTAVYLLLKMHFWFALTVCVCCPLSSRQTRVLCRIFPLKQNHSRTSATEAHRQRALPQIWSGDQGEKHCSSKQGSFNEIFFFLACFFYLKETRQFTL